MTKREPVKSDSNTKDYEREIIRLVNSMPELKGHSPENTARRKAIRTELRDPSTELGGLFANAMANYSRPKRKKQKEYTGKIIHRQEMPPEVAPLGPDNLAEYLRILAQLRDPSTEFGAFLATAEAIPESSEE